MRPKPVATRPLRRLTLLLTALVAVVLSCGREPTGPGALGVRSARGLSFRPVFPAILEQAGGTSTGIVPFTHVHIVLHHADGSVALDTVVDFPPGADSINVALDVALASGAPAAGELLSMDLDYVNAAGVSVFHGGPVTVTAIPSVPGQPPPAPVTIPVSYVGPGAGAAHVVISPRSVTVSDGDSFAFTAVATDAVGTPIPGTPIFWTSLDPTIATITAPGAGTGVAQSVRGIGHIEAQLLTGPTDVVLVQVVLRPSAIAAQSGSGQSATVGAALASPLVAHVTASDGVGVAGVAVTFAVASGGGNVGSAIATTDASGLAQTTWTLGATVGAQTVTASAVGLSGSPVTFSATGLAAVPAKLVVTTPPVSTTAGATLAPVVITAKDALNNTTPSFTGPVSVAFGANPGSATLGGTTTVNAVAGVATFTTLIVNNVGTGYTLVASSAGLTSATTGTFDISAGSGSRLEFGAYPVAGATAGVTMDPITVLTRDATGNVATSFSGVVTLAVGTGPAGATLHGVTTATAVAGIATFNAVNLTTAGSYTLLATATGVASANGPAFPLSAGPAAVLVLASGGGQSAGGGVALPLPVVVQVMDAFGNAVAGAGRTVAFAVVTGGGSVAPPSPTTNVSGQASTTWTLGALAGAQSLSATSAGLTSINVGATATSGIAGPATQLAFGVPPSVTVAGASIAPAIVVQAKDVGNLLATTFTGSVTLAIGANPGASTLGGTLTVAAVGGVATFSNISLNHANTGYTLVASSGLLTQATSGIFTITAGGAASLVKSGGDAQTAPVTSVLPTALSVTVRDTLVNPVPGVTVSWAVATGGGSVSAPTSVTNSIGVATISWTLGATVGAQSVTATKLGLGGSPATFTATGTTSAQVNYTWVGVTDTAWTTASNWSPPGVPAANDSVTIPSGTPYYASITSPVAIKHLVVLTCAYLNNYSILTVSGQLIDGAFGCSLLRAATRAAPSAATRVAPRVPAASLRGALAHDVQGTGGTIILTGTGDLKGRFESDVLITGGTRTMVGETYVYGTVTVSGASTLLDVGGQYADISGDFATATGGKLKMTDALNNDDLTVEGSAVFAGGSTSGLLTNGYLSVYRNFTQGGGAADAFAPSATHETDLGVYSCGECLRGSARSSVQSRLLQQRPLIQRPPSGGGPNARAALEKARLARPARAKSARAVAHANARAAMRQRHAALSGAAPGQATGTSLIHPLNWVAGSMVSFANPGTGAGTSHFGLLYIEGETDLSTNVMVEGELENDGGGPMVSTSGAVLTSRGASLYTLTFDGVRWVLLDGDMVDALDDITFIDMDPTVNQFTVQRTGTGTTGTITPLYYWDFETVPTTGHYISAIGPAALFLDMQYPFPAVSGGFLLLSGGATSNWASSFDWLGLTSSWSTGSNWSTGFEPGQFDDVFIRSSAPVNPVMDGYGNTHNLTIETGKQINLNCSDFFAYGNVVTPLGSEAVMTTCGEGEALLLEGDGSGNNTVVGYFNKLMIDGNYKVSGTGNRVIVTTQLTVEHSGNLTINGGEVDVGGPTATGPGEFDTWNSSATLTMTNSADKLYVGSGGAYFEGGSSLLTAGVLTIINGSVNGLAAGAAFAPGGTFKTVFTGGGQSSVHFLDPNSSFLRNVDIDGGSSVLFLSNATVTGTLTHTAGSNAPVTLLANPGTPMQLTVNGLNQTATYPMNISNVWVLFLYAGPSSTTFDNVVWSGFPPGYTGIVFQVARVDVSQLTFNLHDFSSVVVSGLGVGGSYVWNQGSQTINFTNAVGIGPSFTLMAGQHIP